MAYGRFATIPLSQNPDPGELLINYLFSTCTTKEERSAAINRVMAAEGGQQTIESALAYESKAYDNMRRIMVRNFEETTENYKQMKLIISELKLVLKPIKAKNDQDLILELTERQSSIRP